LKAVAELSEKKGSCNSIANRTKRDYQLYASYRSTVDGEDARNLKRNGH